jgi:hypothetical protein
MDGSKQLHLGEILRGNVAAIQFCEAIHQIVDTWDDLVDRDVAVSSEEINRMMYLSLIEIPRNPFYVVNQSRLTPTLSAVFMAWFAANDFEKTQNEELWILGHGCRHWLATTIVACAEIVGGYAHARAAAPYVWSYLLDDEVYASYRDELRASHAKG